MPKVVLAPALARWLQDSTSTQGIETSMDAGGDHLDGVLEHVFAQHPNLRGYVVDEHGAVRHHVAIFVDGVAIRDKLRLRQPVPARAEVYIMQALSGG